MTFAAAGRVDHDEVVDQVLRAFDKIPTRPAHAAPRARYTGGLSAEEGDSSEVQWILGFEGRAVTHDDAIAAHLAAMVLGGGLSSRLFQALREERGLVYDTSAFHWSFADAGVMAIHFATSPQEVEEACEVVLSEVEDAMRTVSDEELFRAKAQLRAGLLMSRESCSSRMGQAARQAIVFGRPRTKEERIAEIEAVDAASVKRVLSEMVRTAPTLVAVGSMERPRLDTIAARLGGPVPDAA